jgi:hypothetical protein
MARAYLASGRVDRGRDMLTETVEKFPGTSAADDAAAELKKLP